MKSKLITSANTGTKFVLGLVAPDELEGRGGYVRDIGYEITSWSNSLKFDPQTTDIVRRMPGYERKKVYDSIRSPKRLTKTIETPDSLLRIVLELQTLRNEGKIVTAWLVTSARENGRKLDLFDEEEVSRLAAIFKLHTWPFGRQDIFGLES